MVTGCDSQHLIVAHCIASIRFHIKEALDVFMDCEV